MAFVNPHSIWRVPSFLDSLSVMTNLTSAWYLAFRRRNVTSVGAVDAATTAAAAAVVPAAVPAAVPATVPKLDPLTKGIKMLEDKGVYADSPERDMIFSNLRDESCAPRVPGCLRGLRANEPTMNRTWSIQGLVTSHPTGVGYRQLIFSMPLSCACILSPALVSGLSAHAAEWGVGGPSEMAEQPE